MGNEPSKMGMCAKLWFTRNSGALHPGLALHAFQAKLEKKADSTVVTSVQLSSLHPFLTSSFLPNGDKNKKKNSAGLSE